MALSLGTLAPELRDAVAYALEVARERGIPVTVTSLGRTSSQQRRLWQRYQGCLQRGARVWPGNPDRQCRYPAAPPGRSAHEGGWAFDSWVPPQYWREWNEIRRAIGFRLGSGERPVHAQHPDW